MAKKMSEFLESKIGPLRMRSALTLLLCVVNFALAYGICLYYLMDGGPVLLMISLIATVALVLILAFPNLEVQRSFKRRIAREKRAELRKDLNPAMALQPKERSLRFENMRSAEAEKGILRLLLTDDTLFSDTIPIPPERFSSPLLSRAYQRLWEVHAAGSRPMISSLGEEFSREEIDCLTAVCQEPVSTQHAQQALTDYIDVINSEADKRTAQDDPLLAAVEKFKNKKRGKQHV